MAGLGSAFEAAGKKYGIDPRLLVGIAVIESGAGAHMKNANNPFNWGVHRGQTYPSLTASIDDVARGLSQNYIKQGLTTPQQIVSKYAPASDSNNENAWSNTVSEVMQSLGGPATKPSQGNAAVSTQASRPRISQDMSVKTDLMPETLTVPGTTGPEPYVASLLMQGPQALFKGVQAAADRRHARDTAAVATPPEITDPQQPTDIQSGGNEAPAKGMVITSKGWTPTHVTDGLGWGTKTAADIMASPGTPVGAPESGVVVRLGSAQGGQSMYFQGDSGKLYWLGHIDGQYSLAPGTRVRGNETLSRVSADHAHPHLHIDVQQPQ
jgi:murein DD-endopeptidase MepM/ murein hydrolase activator NlpD